MLLEATNSVSSKSKTPLSAQIAFKPRQVLLAEIMKQSKALKPDQKTLLLHSVLRYVEKSGFSRTLKRFLSEAHIEDDNWKASSLDLEDLFCEYLDKCNADRNLKVCTEQELHSDGTNKIDGNIKAAAAASEEMIRKKKKKRSDESDVKAVEDKFDALEKNEDDTVHELQMDVSSKKHKDKKKRKSTPVTESSVAVEGQEKSELVLGNNYTLDFEVAVEPKKEKKKKKKNKPSNDASALEEDTPDNALEEKKVKSKDKKETKVLDQEIPMKLDSVNKSLEETIKKDKKSSKRKRLADENKHEPLKEEVIEEEPKRRKTEAMEEGEAAAKNEDQLMQGEGPKPSIDRPNEHENGNLDNNGGGKSARQKSARKQNNGSAEPKTVNAFQRVKIDEVEFADEKLQDNSYWAKDGAEVGYGAKAQEILGQVRGRDFRHEKTKKKRGSYRGGQIDLNSHSIKFNYSDED